MPLENAGRTVVTQARRALGPVGVCLPASFTEPLFADRQRAAARRLEAAGCRTIWVNEVIGKDALVQSSMLPAATERVVVGTCIANV